MLVGRDAHLAEIESLLDGARAGRGGVLVVTGVPGIGKTRLLEETAARGGDFTVLRARGWELEAALPFAVLADLLGPVCDAAGLAPAPAAALAGALGLGPPFPADRFSVYQGAVGVLRAAGEHGPVLCLVDDAQWADMATWDALAFISRRLADHPVLIVVAARAGERAGLPDARHLVLDGIGRDAAAALLAARAPVPVAAGVAARLHEATAGNPLALSELAAELTPAELGGRHPFPDPLPLSAGVAAAFARRAAALPAPARRLLLLAAAAGPQGMLALGAAAARAGLDLADLEHAEREGLIEVGDSGPVFRHPLMRSSVYRAADPAERREAHRVMAEALAVDGSPELRAWHLAAAALAPEEVTAAALDLAADRAAARSAYAVAAGARERAAALSPHPERRARRLLAASRDWVRAGRPDLAAGFADGAAADAPTVPLRSEARRTAGRIALLRGSPRLAGEILLAEADAPGHPPARVARLLAEAVSALVLQGDLRAAVATARRAVQAADASGDSWVREVAGGALGAALVPSGRTREGAPLLGAYLDAAERRSALGGDPLGILAIRALVWMGDAERADVLLARRVAALRGSGALGLLGFPLASQLEIDLRAARWSALAERAEEVIRLACDTGQEKLLFTVHRELARVAAAQGREDDCLRHVEDMGRVTGSSDMAARASALAVLGFLELGLGRGERAVAHLEETAWIARSQYGLREPNVLRWPPDLVEACIHAGRPDTARRELAMLAREARGSTADWTRAVAARCAGMLAPPAEAEPCFLEALAFHGNGAEPFERARTELVMGERRRRLRRRAQAREPLESAYSTFVRLGAWPWAERARGELAASGAVVASPLGAGPAAEPVVPERLDGLTAQERRLAAMVAAGKTNREVAAIVHLSPKTVEEHLSRLYRKLGVRSRTELASVVLARASSEPVRA